LINVAKVPVPQPGAIHEGNGVWRTIVDEHATKEQREALIALANGQQGGAYWEVFAAVCPNRSSRSSPPQEMRAAIQ
jgi:hypothetical protein